MHNAVRCNTVLLFVDRMRVGGIQTLLVELIDQFLASGQPCELLLLDDGEHYDLEDEVCARIPVHKLEGIWMRKPQDFLRYSRAVERFFAEHHDYRAVHLNSGPKNFPILRYSDVLLMLAEAENELEGPSNAVKYLNEVRQRAFGGVDTYNVKAGALTKEDLRQIIKDERGRELCFEMLRHFDLIRWGELADRMSELVSWAQIGGEWNQGPTNVYTYFMLDDTYNYFPIPDAEISVNREITSNNPGW